MTKEYMLAHPHCMEQCAIRHYGETEELECGGYLLCDGTMLNFSHDGYHRTEDHRSISWFTSASGWDALMAFMRRGNIRINCHPYHYGFDMVTEPTASQLAVMRRAEYTAMRRGYEFYIDRLDMHGNVVYSSRSVYGKEVS